MGGIVLTDFVSRETLQNNNQLYGKCSVCYSFCLANIGVSGCCENQMDFFIL